jgi:hypothetical protein
MTTSNHTDFDIRHFSVHQGRSEVGEIDWIDVNIVFAISPEFQIYARSAADEWVTGVVYEGVTDSKEVTDFYDKLPIEKFHQIRHPKRVVGLTLNNRAFLNYIEKFDVYQCREIVEDNRVTRALLREIGELMNGKDVSSRFVPASRLMRCLECLAIFWD